MAFVNLLQAIYPVGSVYISAVNISPSEIIGGAWEQITDKFLYANNSPASIGGSTNHSHSLSSNGGACIDIIGQSSSTQYWINVLSRSSGKSFDIQYQAAYPVTDKNNSTITNQQHAVALLGDTDISDYMPPYYTVCLWIRKA